MLDHGRWVLEDGRPDLTGANYEAYHHSKVWGLVSAAKDGCKLCLFVKIGLMAGSA